MMRVKDWFYAALMGLALLGMACLWASTSQGSGVGGDATIYLKSAENLIKGVGLGLITANGEFRLLPYFPPFFPLVLSGFMRAGLDGLQAARWLHIVLFGALAWMAGSITRSSGVNRWASLTAAALIVASPILYPAFSWVMAEPLAILLGFASLGCMLIFLEGTRGQRWLVISAILGGLSAVTRYSSVAFLITGVLGIIWLTRVAWRTKVRNIAVFSAISLSPLVLWILVDIGLTATVSSRSLLDPQGMGERFKAFWPAMEQVLLFWLIPESWITHPPYPQGLNTLAVPVLALLFLAGLAWGLFAETRKNDQEKPSRWMNWTSLLFYFSVSYLLVTLTVFVSTYPPITIGIRMFAPMCVAVFWAVSLIWSKAVQQPTQFAWFSKTLAGLMILWLAWWGWRSARIIDQNAEMGMGFTSPAWQTSLTIEHVKALSADQQIVTNEEMAVLFLTGRKAYPLAEIYLDHPLEDPGRYGDGVLEDDTAQAAFRGGGAVLVLFDSINQQFGAIYGDMAAERLQQFTEGLVLIYDGPDGSIYAYPE